MQRTDAAFGFVMCGSGQTVATALPKLNHPSQDVWRSCTVEKMRGNEQYLPTARFWRRNEYVRQYLPMHLSEAHQMKEQR